jgi:hypothetical protein
LVQQAFFLESCDEVELGGRMSDRSLHPQLPLHPVHAPPFVDPKNTANLEKDFRGGEKDPIKDLYNP